MFAVFVVNTLLLSADFVNKFMSDDIVVHLSHGGQVRGISLQSTELKTFYAFRGIPYAEPPIGQLRFKEPIPKSGWSGSPLDATIDGPLCAQEPYDDIDGGEEDCLMLNVYTPELPEGKNFSEPIAVMVFIHGGSFLNGGGTSEQYRPHNFMDFNVVLVTLNYRLDALGFLSTGDSSSPGNYGMLDQRLALLWVRDNIEAFGGDKHSVTIFGQSAGGASVSYHLLSPLSKGLFHGAITMSGSCLNPWALESNPLYWAKHVAKELGCPQEPTKKLISCLRRKPANDINKGSGHYVRPMLVPTPFVPNTDAYFLPAPPRTLLSSSETVNKVPVLTGITLEEMALPQITGTYELEGKEKMMSDKYLTYLFNSSISNHDAKIIQMIRNRYLTAIDPTNGANFVKTVVKALSHGMFDMNHYEEVMLLSKVGLPVYSYSYNYVTDFFRDTLPDDEYAHLLSVPMHGSDLDLIFQRRSLDVTENDKKMAKTMLRIWTNFAKSGNPDPTNEFDLHWKPSTADEIHIYNLDLKVTRKVYIPKEDELFHFWTREIQSERTAKKESG